jgi:hypothetical protein
MSKVSWLISEVQKLNHLSELGQLKGLANAASAEYESLKLELHYLKTEVKALRGDLIQVICKVCGNSHDSILPRGYESDIGHQGLDCASECWERGGKYYLACSFGSDFDGDVFRLKTLPSDKWIDADPVCDNCINEQVLSHNFEYLGNYLHVKDLFANLDDAKEVTK